jgi:hypothetical protein
MHLSALIKGGGRWGQRRLALAGALLLSAGIVSPAQAAPQTPAASSKRLGRIVAVTEAPTIDGVLNEAVWGKAEVLTHFVQRVPHYGEPASGETEIRLLHDEKYIYVGACMQQDPATIRRNKLRHRDSVFLDDTIEVVFDTFHDQRRGYIFLTNPNGAKHDTQVDGIRQYNDNWDEVWDVRTSLQPDGWCAEFRIPIRILRFPPGHDVWGFNVQRRIQANKEWDYWAPIPPQYDISNLSLAGEVSGFAELRQQRNLQVIPALVSTRLQTEAPNGASYELKPSLDLKYVLGANLTLDMTANTDFAQVEADETQVNLTRFSLFFPEKREFFLESARIFDFGVQRDTEIFFSRRIGIAEGQEVPIMGGARLTGKVGPYELGLLNMQTKDSPVQAATNYTALRARRGLSGRSTVGAIFTNVSRPDYKNHVLGLDADLWLSPNVELQGFVAGVQGTGIGSPAYAHQVRFDYQTDPWGITLWEKTVDPDFDPGIGFVQRQDIRDWTGELRRRFRLNRSWSRTLDLTGSLTYLTDVGNQLRTRLASFQVSDELPTGDLFRFTYERQFEQLTEDFAIRPDLGIVIPLAAYPFERSTISWQSEQSRRFVADSSFSWGSFFGGQRQEVSAGNTYYLSRHFDTGWEYEYNRVRLPAGNFSTSLARARINYNYNSNIGVSGLLQWNSTTQDFSANIRFRILYGHDSNIFFVYNERQTDEDTGWVLGQRALIFKLTYRLYL